MVQRAITAMNATLPSFSTVKKFALLPRDLSVEDGELTPSLKVKRKVVESNYSDLLEDFYKGTLAAL